MTELCILAGKDDIAMAGELRRPGQAEAMHLRDYRLRQRPQSLPAVDHLLQVAAVVMHGEARTRLLRRLQVIARAKRPSRATDYEDARFGVGLKLLHRAIELLEQLLRHRVELLGPVERQPENPLFGFLVNDGLVISHGDASRG